MYHFKFTENSESRVDRVGTFQINVGVIRSSYPEPRMKLQGVMIGKIGHRKTNSACFLSPTESTRLVFIAIENRIVVTRVS